MKSSINLLVDKKTSFGDNIERYKSLRFVSVGILFTIAIISVSLFLLIALSPLNALRREENEQIAKLRQIHDKRDALLFVNERLNNIHAFLDTRPPVEKNIQWLQSQLPGGSTITDYTLEGKTISFSIQAQSLDTLNTAITTLKSLSDKKDTVSKVSMKSLGLNADATSYNLSMELSLL